jgi:hypothetical protein
LKISGFNNENDFYNLSDECVPNLLREIKMQIIRCAKISKTSLDETTKTAYVHLKELYYSESAFDQYEIPVKFQEIIRLISNVCKQNHKVEDEKTAKMDARNSVENINNSEFKRFPAFLQMLIENSLRNMQGNKNNKYDETFKEVCCIIFIRGGPKLYTFLQTNLNLPDESTIRKFLNDCGNLMPEGKLFFEELVHYVRENNYGFDIGVFEDGTKVMNSNFKLYKIKI